MIKIKNRLPGPKAKQVLKLDAKYVSNSHTRPYPLVIDSAKGMYIKDVDGNQFLDFVAGVAVCSTGHLNPYVISAIKKQLNKFLHMCNADFYYKQVVDLAKVLTEVSPGKFPKKVFFGNSGAEAVEAAFKLVRYHSRRPRMISFIGGFHGRTFGALSLTNSKIIHREHFAPLVPEVSHIPYPYCYRCPYYLRYGSCNMHCIKVIEDVYFKSTIPPDEVAAFVIEPIQGERGYIVPPKEYFPELFKLAKKYGILMVLDEVQSGMGRTGKFFAIEHWGVEPDIICSSKGIASGMPLGAIIAKASIMDWKEGSHTNTFGGNPVSCVAALATIDLIRKKLMKNAREVGEYLSERLNLLKDEFEVIGDVRGKGLMQAIEIIKDGYTKEKDVKLRNRILNDCLSRGLLIIGCGDNVIRFCPPLIVTKNHVDMAMDILTDVLNKGTKKGY